MNDTRNYTNKVVAPLNPFFLWQFHFYFHRFEMSVDEMQTKYQADVTTKVLSNKLKCIICILSLSVSPEKCGYQSFTTLSNLYIKIHMPCSKSFLFVSTHALFECFEKKMANELDEL